MTNVNVSLSIGGRHYVMTCAAGEDAHIKYLGGMIDAKLNQVPGGTGQNESRALLFAALLLADEVHDLKKGIPTPSEPAPSLPPERLEALADRLEALAATLEVPAYAQPAAQV
jgi:cell division protein ZapA